MNLPLICEIGEPFIIDSRYRSSNLISCLWSATFSCRTVLNCSFSSSCNAVERVWKKCFKTECLLNLNCVSSRPQSYSQPWNEFPLAEQKVHQLQLCALSLAQPLEILAHQLPSVGSWPRPPCWKYRFPSLTGCEPPELEAKIERMRRRSSYQQSDNTFPQLSSHRKLVLWCSDLCPLQCLSTRLRSISRGFL